MGVNGESQNMRDLEIGRWESATEQNLDRGGGGVSSYYMQGTFD